MFVRAFAELRIPCAGASALLQQLPLTLVESFAIEAVDRGHTVLAEVGFPVGPRRLGKQVQIGLGDAIKTPSRTWLPLTWTATGPTSFFPSLEGELEAAPLGKERTQIGLSARYKPPFGVVGSTLDRMFLHRVAEATVADFLQRVVSAIEDGWRLQRSAPHAAAAPSGGVVAGAQG